MKIRELGGSFWQYGKDDKTDNETAITTLRYR
jgi:hypothetical protein